MTLKGDIGDGPSLRCLSTEARLISIKLGRRCSGEPSDVIYISF
jgi:hypothetical protein